MKYAILILLFFSDISLSPINAQTAPNFTVTDSWGQSHRLYEDYLDQDMTVVLKIFFVACPPCNAIAPHLEPLYQTWGAGSGDVQFIELSTKQSDTNAQVNTYKNTHATTYPAAGGQGNSVAAATPYMNGTFGLWTGTPTFVVIAPDGSVNYDVHGNNISGTIGALNAAIAATGADGVATGISNKFDSQKLSLASNIIDDELVINVLQEMGDVEIDIMNTSGQIITSQHTQTSVNFPIQMDMAMLTKGTWICRISNDDNRIVASYLFVKM